jgi:hypothetical protein
MTIKRGSLFVLGMFVLGQVFSSPIELIFEESDHAR